MSADVLLRAEGLVVHFPVTQGLFGRVVGQVQAVDGVSFEIRRGETLGLVGESGCGKTTVGRAILRLLEPTAGRILFDGTDVTALPPSRLRALRPEMQIIFQDPFSSLNPRMTVRDIVGEALEVHGLASGPELEARVASLLEKVGISRGWLDRYPHEFSGGQRQRIGIARAIALEPKLVICDEAVSALDVSIQAQVINLLIRLRRELGLAYLFIAHDLSVVKHIADRIAVMYLGQLVETAASDALFREPGHPYTRALLSAIPTHTPRQRRERIVLEGDVPTPLDPPAGCRFHTRCPAAVERCRSEDPRAIRVAEGHWVKCFHAYEVEPGRYWHDRMVQRTDAATQANRARRVAGAAPAAAPAAPRPGEAAPARAPSRRRIETRPVWRRGIGLALYGGGAALALLSAPVWGALAALGGYGLLRGLDYRGRRYWAGVMAAGVALFALAGMGLEAWGRHSTARVQLAGLEAALVRRAALTGASPESLSELGWRLVPIFGELRAVDPWGRPWRYRAPGRAGHSFEVSSAGPDGAWDTDDDVARPPQAAAQ